jgi:hypothetical protein
LDARLITLLCKKYIVAKSKGVKQDDLIKENLAEPSKEGYGSKRAVFQR